MKKEEKTIINVADIALIEGCSNSTASRRYNLCMVSLAKTKFQKITVPEYAAWSGIDIKLIKEKINS